MKICLKELRETKIILKIITKAIVKTDNSKLNILIEESDELISIFMKSVSTATQNKKLT
jgi:hypothetical protein